MANTRRQSSFLMRVANATASPLYKCLILFWWEPGTRDRDSQVCPLSRRDLAHEDPMSNGFWPCVHQQGKEPTQYCDARCNEEWDRPGPPPVERISDDEWTQCSSDIAVGVHDGGDRPGSVASDV